MTWIEFLKYDTKRHFRRDEIIKNMEKVEYPNIKGFTKEDIEATYNKISDLEDKFQVDKKFFKKLSDTEFSILWYMPNINIYVNYKTKKYIEKRRLSLGLIETKCL